MTYLAFDDFFTVLANKNRVRIVQYLNDQGPKNVGDIADKLKVEQSIVSHNLRRLLGCHFVSVKQAGKQRLYTVNQDTISPLLGLIERHVEANCAKGCQHWD